MDRLAALLGRVRRRARRLLGLTALTALRLSARFVIVVLLFRFALRLRLAFGVTLLFAVVTVDSLALVFVADILVVTVEAVNVLLNVVSHIGDDNMVVQNLLLHLVLAHLNTVAVLDLGFDIGAVIDALSEFSVAERLLDLVLDLVTGSVALLTALVSAAVLPVFGFGRIRGVRIRRAGVRIVRRRIITVSNDNVTLFGSEV